jgi:hypothetical protein
MSADLTIPAELMDGIRATVETTFPYTATISRPADVSAGKAGPPTQVATNVPMSIFTPQREPQIQLLADLGEGRASMLGFAPYGTSIQAGDIVTASGVTYNVVATATPPDMVICALSRQRPR